MATTEIPSALRPVPGSVNVPLAHFPLPAKVSTSATPETVATNLVSTINNLLASTPSDLADLFVANGYWRDHLALTWEFHTASTTKGIRDFLLKAGTSRDGFRLKKVALDKSSLSRAPKVVKMSGGKSTATNAMELECVQFVLDLETAIGTGRGLVNAVQEEQGVWRIYTMYTSMRELANAEEAINGRRPKGVVHGANVGRKNWKERRAAEENFGDGAEPAVFVLGGGQAGLTIAARLKMLGISTLVIDKNPAVGDNWRNRYHQLVLHDPVWYDHLPYLPFPSSWPIFTPKDKLAQFFEAYAALLELNIWTSTTMESAVWSDDDKRWTVTVEREVNGKKEKRTFHPRHVIQATGHSGKKNMPEIPGTENFKGLLVHSSEFRGAKQQEDPASPKHAVVVGSCNSAHDIAQDYVEKGYHVTIIQRSTTHVVSSKAIVEVGLKALFSEDGPPVDDADLLLHGLPVSVLKALQVRITENQKKMDAEMHIGLAKAGFKTDDGPDDAGLFIKYFQRGGGYYIDVGAAALIASGRISIKQGCEIDRVTPTSLVMSDGSELPADEVVFATGYQNMRTQTRLTFGDEVAKRVGDVWGFTEEGEMRVMWQRSGHPGFWFHGGNLAICRYYSRFLALQIAGVELGVTRAGEI